MRNAVRFVKEAGADAVKLEGAGATLSRVVALVGAEALDDDSERVLEVEVPQPAESGDPVPVVRGEALVAEDGAFRLVEQDLDREELSASSEADR